MGERLESVDGDLLFELNTCELAELEEETVPTEALRKAHDRGVRDAKLARDLTKTRAAD
jgi:hypothetical protein